MARAMAASRFSSGLMTLACLGFTQVGIPQMDSTVDSVSVNSTSMSGLQVRGLM